jgi:putative membrane protein
LCRTNHQEKEVIVVHDWGMMNWGWGGAFFQLLFWIVLIVVIIWAVKYLTAHGRGTTSSSSEESALDILRKRYARGEIDKEEFERKKQDLIS